jgi:hypothetical protein
MASAVKTLRAKAHFDGDRREVYLRTAPVDGKIYLDKCDAQWRAIEIDADGFRVVDDPPVHFRREAGMLPLPTPSTIDPKKGIARLEEVPRLRDKSDFVVIFAWLLAALAGRSPYGVIIFSASRGRPRLPPPTPSARLSTPTPRLCACGRRSRTRFSSPPPIR